MLSASPESPRIEPADPPLRIREVAGNGSTAPVTASTRASPSGAAVSPLNDRKLPPMTTDVPSGETVRALTEPSSTVGAHGSSAPFAALNAARRVRDGLPACVKIPPT